MQNYSSAEIVNVGWGKDIRISELAEMIRGVVGFAGDTQFDESKPDGAPSIAIPVHFGEDVAQDIA